MAEPIWIRRRKKGGKRGRVFQPGGAPAVFFFLGKTPARCISIGLFVHQFQVMQSANPDRASAIDFIDSRKALDHGQRPCAVSCDSVGHEITPHRMTRSLCVTSRVGSRSSAPARTRRTSATALGRGRVKGRNKQRLLEAAPHPCRPRKRRVAPPSLVSRSPWSV